MVVSALLLTVSACSKSGAGEVTPSEIPVAVEVTNQHALPMEIAAVGSGIVQRLGTVHPGMNARFQIPHTMVGNGSVQLEARPSGGGQPFRSGEVLLAPGAVLDFTISAQLFNSTVTRRP
jgi:hypothetical protein